MHFLVPQFPADNFELMKNKKRYCALTSKTPLPNVPEFHHMPAYEFTTEIRIKFRFGESTFRALATESMPLSMRTVGQKVEITSF